METVVIFGCLLLLLLTGLPVFVSLAVISIAALLLTGQNLAIIPLSMYGSTENFVLLAVPLFLLMAHIMTKGGVGDDLFDFVHAWLKHLPGGLAMTTVVTLVGDRIVQEQQHHYPYTTDHESNYLEL